MEMEREKEQEFEWLKAQKIEITVDLLAAAKQQLQFLAAVDKNRWLYDGPTLDRAIFRYNACWLPLLAKHLESPISEGPLVVPLDCEWIWHCHRLNPLRYKSDCEELYGKILDYSDVVSSVNGVCKRQTEEIWNRFYPHERYDLDLDFSEAVNEKISTLEKCTNYDLVSAVKRQSPFFYQVSRPHMNNDIFLQGAIARYKGFLHIIKRNWEKSINCFCVPTYDIDLIWHTHQLHPVSYCKDVSQALGRILEHDDMDSDRSKGNKLDVGFFGTTRHWEETFGRRYWKAGAMYRGSDPSPLTTIPFQSNILSKELEKSNQNKKMIELSELKIVEVLLEIVGVKNLPERHKGNLFVMFNKKQPDLFFNVKRKASSSLAFPSLQTQFQSLKKPSSPKPSTRRFSVRPIRASISENPSVPGPPATVSPSEPTKLPIRKIPGDHGLPLIGPFKDRLDYFYNQGRDEYFKSKIQKYRSTVFRANMPPGPFIAPNPQVVVLLDGKSFPVLFDVTKVEKKDLFTGTFMPSTELTGGYRVLSYLDPSEPKHAKLKQLMFYLLKSRRDHVIPEFNASYTELFTSLEKNLALGGKASFGEANDQAAFNFLARSWFGTDPAETTLGLDGPGLVAKWVLFNLGPVLKLGLPKYLEDLTIHSFRLPPSLIKKSYQRLYDFFYASSGFLLDEAENLGISREEACHNLLFTTCFNSFGGMRILFPNMMKWLGRAGTKLHARLAEEIRSVVRSNDGSITMRGMEEMPLMKSVVYEALRIEPPVSLQFGRAKRDLIIESHDAAFEVKEGEMLFGFQPFATKDPKIFTQAEEFVADRFIGEGEKMLEHVLWSNGPETEEPTLGNKQCAGKDFVVLVSRLFVVELFLRYDSFEIEVGTSPLGAAVTVTSLRRASF